jgi:hypothetical protein
MRQSVLSISHISINLIFTSTQEIATNIGVILEVKKPGCSWIKQVIQGLTQDFKPRLLITVLPCQPAQLHHELREAIDTIADMRNSHHLEKSISFQHCFHFLICSQYSTYVSFPF